MTARGWALLASSVACLALSQFLSYVELSVLGVSGLAALGLGLALGLRRPSLRIRREIAPAEVARGEPALGLVTVTGTGRFATPALVAIDRCGPAPVPVELPRLPRGRTHTATAFLPTAVRGLVPVGPLEVTVFDPLGLFRRVHRYGQPSSLLVHPRTVRLLPLPSGRLASVDGPPSMVVPGGTVTFHALREYAFGDDLRHVHWRTSARTGTLMVRLLADNSLPRTTVLLDNRPSSYSDPDEFELAVDVAASVATAATRAGFPVSVATADGPLVSTEDTSQVLRELALLGSSSSAPLYVPAGSAGSLTVVTGSVPSIAPPPFDRVAVVHVRLVPSDATASGRSDATPQGMARRLVRVSKVEVSSLADLVTTWRRLVRS
jgi:uncharacterized protein (DUF58 family)